MDQLVLTRKATALFDAMQQIVEDRPAPIIEAYHDDFYKHDRRTLGAIFSPNARYLWLLYPHGSQLDRVGVLPQHECSMNAALNTFERAHPMSKMELRMIETDGAGDFKMRRMPFDFARAILRAIPYTRRGSDLWDSHGPVAQIETKVHCTGPGVYAGTGKISSYDRILSRGEVLAATMYLCKDTYARTGTLLTPITEIQVDGRPIDEVAPRLVIEDVVRGRYAPAQGAAQAEECDRALRPRSAA